MAFHESYRRQVALLLRAMPLIAEENSFALKGGTAINLFVRDLPRLSVDHRSDVSAPTATRQSTRCHRQSHAAHRPRACKRASEGPALRTA
jgi:Nucleotidyl transferase AbiEii toxin, Type IV TA system